MPDGARASADVPAFQEADHGVHHHAEASAGSEASEREVPGPDGAPEGPDGAFQEVQIQGTTKSQGQPKPLE